MDDNELGDVQAALLSNGAIAEHGLHALDHIDGLHLSVLPSGDGAWAVGVEDLEEKLPHPREKRGGRSFTSADSFIAYVNRQKTDATVVYAAESGVLTAIIDDHQAASEPDSKAGWGRHVAKLERPLTLAWKAWRERSGKPMSQEGFAEFLETRMRDIGEPDGATLFELVRFFQASKSISFKSSRRLDNGEVQFTYDEEVSGGSVRAGETSVPTTFVVALSRYRDDEPAPFEVRLRWRLNGPELTFTFLFDEDEVEQAIEDAELTTRARVETECEVPVYLGSYTHGSVAI